MLQSISKSADKLKDVYARLEDATIAASATDIKLASVRSEMSVFEEKSLRLDRAEAALQEAQGAKIQMSLELGRLKESIAMMTL